jgi:hypothetical protein
MNPVCSCDNYENKDLMAIVNNSTNINKTNNHFSL